MKFLVSKNIHEISWKGNNLGFGWGLVEGGLSEMDGEFKPHNHLHIM
jgi:hypothetical protein